MPTKTFRGSRFGCPHRLIRRVHELTHLLERHRNARFMAHMDNFLPNWQSIKQQLNALELFAQIYNLT
ncbi:TPA: DUF45 domain-containing protein [Neisseria meningitidis]|nr:DUF45 domain-containing protein [Neisseria meningitidis]MBG8592950.1 DUF45 domain-containing protein [Neisseria meningitidis]MBG8601845.1 DUF45 domain-containing protein [Neisseria meningitidis]MBG8603953.1 DUF45 domain-containing protein [Neisseria meningitidis]MBG8608515.1 DUF45 domain-containing protein [Neisseria meningitidis]